MGLAPITGAQLSFPTDGQLHDTANQGAHHGGPHTYSKGWHITHTNKYLLDK